MSLLVKSYKDIENKVHEQLYNNIFLLTCVYPTSKEFKLVFKKDMFVKSNKTAFFEMVYYLLKTLNPELTKQCLTLWPPYDIQSETKFRNEVLKCINQLNSLYSNADIPVLMASHLISPGGYKFGMFMLKLSQLVIYEHLKKDIKINKELLSCVRSSKNANVTTAILKNLKLKTNAIEVETKKVLEGFEKFRCQAKRRATDIMNEQANLNTEIKKVKEIHSQTKQEFHKKYPLYPSVDCLAKSIDILERDAEYSEKLQILVTECAAHLSHYLNKNVVLSHNKNDLKVPDEIAHIVNNKEELDLHQFFHGVEVLLGRKSLELPNPTNSFLTETLEQLRDLSNKFSNLELKLLEREDELLLELERSKKSRFVENAALSNGLENGEKNTKSSIPLIIVNSNSESTEPLAVPLEETP